LKFNIQQPRDGEIENIKLYDLPRIQESARIAILYLYQYFKHSFASIISDFNEFLLSVIINFDESNTHSHSANIIGIVNRSKAILISEGYTLS
jgi:hypothetical protein